MKIPKLIALDMDGTLLDGQGQLPPQFPRLAARAAELGVILAPASGRQLGCLEQMFPEMDTFIAENGTVIVLHGQLVSTSPLNPADVHAVLRACTDLQHTTGIAHTVVLCTPYMAYVQATPSPAAVAELQKYYQALSCVDSLTDLLNTRDQPLEIIKIAVYCAAGTEEHIAPELREVVDPANVAVSGQFWVDVMAAGANKGQALEKLARALGIESTETCAFGDYLNDLELLAAAGLAIAMENAHPEVKALADRIAPPNTEYGVITVLEEILGSA